VDGLEDDHGKLDGVVQAHASLQRWRREAREEVKRYEEFESIFWLIATLLEH
jgi:hypothetical protein